MVLSTVPTDLCDRLSAYFARCPYPVVLAYLFGSQASGRTTPVSDVDVAVFLRETVSLDHAKVYPALLRDLIAVSGTDQVDLSLLNDAYDGEGFGAVRYGRLIYSADERVRVRVEAQVVSRHLDRRDLDSIRGAYLERRIRTGTMGEGSIAMIEERAVRERLDYIDGMLRLLKGYRAMDLEAFVADERTYHAAIYELQTCLEAATDIGNHLIAALSLPKPDDRPTIFSILSRAGLLPGPVAEAMAKAVGMRNVLVHGYLRVVGETVYRTICEDPGQIEAFCRRVVECLEREASARQGKESTDAAD